MTAVINIVAVLFGLSFGGGMMWVISYYRHQVLSEKNKEFQSQHSALNLKLEDEREKSIHLQTSLAEANITHKNLEERLQTQKQEMETLQKKFTLEFENLANKIFEEKSTTFAKKNQENMDGVLKPFNEKLAELKKQVEEKYGNEARERASLQGEIKQLFQLNQTMAKEAKNLTTALKGGSKTQGNWGEMILETILEKSGLQKGREFVTQSSFQTEDGRRQHPDVIINLPEGKHMVIDSKVSLTAYELCFSSENEVEREAELKKHVLSVRTHMKQLGEKKYPSLSSIGQSPIFWESHSLVSCPGTVPHSPPISLRPKKRIPIPIARKQHTIDINAVTYNILGFYHFWVFFKLLEAPANTARPAAYSP